MQISIVDCQRVLTAETRELAERRLLFALSRFASKISCVSLTMSDENGPKGGADKKCSVTVKLKRLPEVRGAGVEGDVEASICHVADRAGRTVQRTVERSHEFDRMRLSSAKTS